MKASLLFLIESYTYRHCSRNIAATTLQVLVSTGGFCQVVTAFLWFIPAFLSALCCAIVESHSISLANMAYTWNRSSSPFQTQEFCLFHMHCIPMHHPVKLSVLKSRKIIHMASSYASVHCIMLSIGSQILKIPQTVLTWLYKKNSAKYSLESCSQTGQTFGQFTPFCGILSLVGRQFLNHP
jgi:hypothetical protein